MNEPKEIKIDVSDIVENELSISKMNSPEQVQAISHEAWLEVAHKINVRRMQIRTLLIAKGVIKG